jgi:tripartite ATP-independent transporter DctP family solute receptor
MLSKSASFFLTGVFVGVLVSTVGYSLVLRHSNGNKSDHVSRMGKVLKLAHTLDQKHPVHEAMTVMANRLREKSGGTLTIEIFPNGQLGSETECIEQLQQGALALTKTSAAPLESFIPELAIFGVPYLFRDEAHFWRLIESELGQQLLAAGSGQGIRGLCYYDAGARSFYTVKRPVLSPSDLEGMKIRVQQSKTAMDMVEALGGKPTPIPFGELYTALQSSLVDGAENNPPSFHTSRHYEVCRHLSLDEHARVPDLLLMSSQVWETLSDPMRKWVKEAAEESAVFQRELWAKETARLIEAIKKEGVEVHRPDQGPFLERVKSMHQGFAGTRIGELIESIRSL